MKKIVMALAAAVAFAFVPAIASAQETAQTEKKVEKDVFDMNNSFGVFGEIGGQCYHYGFQYDRWFSNRMGFSVGGFMVGSVENDSKFFWENIEAEFRYALFQDTYNSSYSHRFFTFAMLGYWNHYNEGYEYYDDDEKSIDMTNNVNIGAGIAYEMILGKRVSVIFNFGIEAAFPNEVTVSPMGGTAVKFRW